MKKQTASFIHLGFSSIIILFLMICLAAFACLSVLTSHSDYRLSEKMAEQTTTYYQADALAREKLAEIDNELYMIYLDSPTKEAFYEEAGTSITYTVPITETQTLYVTLGVHYPLNSNEYFTTIEQWQTITN